MVEKPDVQVKRQALVERFSRESRSWIAPGRDALEVIRRRTPAEKSISPFAPLVIGLLIVVLAGSIAGLSSMFEVRLLCAAAGVIGLVGASLNTVQRVRKIDELRALCNKALADLEQTAGQTDGFITALDKRALLIFGGLTSTKILTYYMLIQIRNSLATLVKDVHTLLSARAVDALDEAVRILQGELVFSDSFDGTSGQELRSPLVELKAKVQLLMSELRQGIDSAEDEVKSQWADLRNQKNNF